MEQFGFLIRGFQAVTWQMLVMWAVGGLLIWLAVKKDFEPSLLIPMGFGAILVNLPFSGVLGNNGIVQWLYHVGIGASEAMPLLLFVGIGAMIDFGPLLSNPRMFLFGGAAQFGIFFTVLMAVLLGFPLKDAMSAGVIGAADGPTSILVAQTLKSNYTRRHHRGGLLLHGARAGDPAVCHQTRDDEERAPHPHAVPPGDGLENDEDPVPDHRDGGCGADCAGFRGARRFSDVRQPHPRMRQA